MKVQYASDLHLEFRANREWLCENPLEVTGYILLLAVPGNHEFYGSDVKRYWGSLTKMNK